MCPITSRASTGLSGGSAAAISLLRAAARPPDPSSKAGPKTGSSIARTLNSSGAGSAARIAITISGVAIEIS
ncbi:MAG: hypothetical protein V9H25_18325 [Candidatus Competibacter sp.]